MLNLDKGELGILLHKFKVESPKTTHIRNFGYIWWMYG
jgi:hypothetical protein